MTIEYAWTQDELRLMGVHYQGKDTCVVGIHGMSGNFIENYFANVLGEKLSKLGYGFIFGHNRGYSHVNDIVKKPMSDSDNGWSYVRIGEMYELFEDSPKDIAAWVTKAKGLGYKRVILLGHSLGCNKTIYYLYKNPKSSIDGIILASPPDMVGSARSDKYKTSHSSLIEQARKFMSGSQPKELLDGKLWDWYKISAQTYISLFEEDGEADNLPVLRNPKRFTQLEALHCPILAIVGEFDDIKIRDLKEDMELIKSKAINCPDFRIQIIGGANHNYENREDIFASTVSDWVVQLQ